MSCRPINLDAVTSKYISSHVELLRMCGTVCRTPLVLRICDLLSVLLSYTVDLTKFLKRFNVIVFRTAVSVLFRSRAVRLTVFSVCFYKLLFDRAN